MEGVESALWVGLVGGWGALWVGLSLWAELLLKGARFFLKQRSRIPIGRCSILKGRGSPCGRGFN